MEVGGSGAGEAGAGSTPPPEPGGARGIITLMRCCRSLLLVFLAVPLVAGAAEWGSIVPGETTQEVVRARYGEPTRRAAQKIDGYDTTEWVYDGARAPRGIRRLVLEFGLLTAAGYRPDVVRVLRLEPAPGMFTRALIERGWGVPNRVGKDRDTPVYFYESGLVVLFDTEGWMAVSMVFTLPQPTASR